MGNIDTPHAGIELDAISISDLISSKDGQSCVATLADPMDYKIFVSSVFKKMKAHNSFLSFSRQISDVNRILAMNYSSANDIADVILKDMALTSKVLKLVNSSFYRHFSSKGISTISEAMIILGTEEIKLAAASLKIYEMMSNLTNSGVLKDKTLKGLQRSLMARQIAQEGSYLDGDAIQIAAMLYDFGEYLVALFAPEQYIAIEIAMDEQKKSRQEASKSILGLSYNDLGRVVALKLHMPEKIVNAMRPVSNLKQTRDQIGALELNRYVCAFTKDLCDIPLTLGSQQTKYRIIHIVSLYQDILNIDTPKALELVNNSWEKILQHAALLNIDPKQNENQDSGIKNQKSLDSGLRQIKKILDSNLGIQEVFSNMVNILYNCFYFSNVCICIKKKETQTMEARFSAGRASGQMLTSFRFKLENSADVFNIAVQKNLDLIIRKNSPSGYRDKIPKWYTDQGFSEQFAVFPVFVDKKIISAIYVDWPGETDGLSSKTIDYLKIFRELVIKAFVLHKKKSD